MSVRFLGRRVYLGMMVVLMSLSRTGARAATRQLPELLAVPRRTLLRWSAWWQEAFPLTTLWQASSARFLPPVAVDQLPGSLLERFAGAAGEPLLRLLHFLSPLTVGRPVTLQESR